MKFYLFGLLASALFLQGCATAQKRTLLNTSTRTQIQSVSLYNYVLNDEITPAVEISNVTGALGGGLIPALVDSSINSKRATAAALKATDFYNSTDKIDYRKILAKEINGAGLSAFKIKNPKESAENIFLNNKDLTNKIGALSPDEHLLVLQSNYGFMENSNTISMNMNAWIFSPGGAKKSAKPKPIYFNTFHYISQPSGKSGDEALGSWAAKDGALFSSALTEGAQELASMLKYDLQNDVQVECGNETKVSIYGINNLKMDVPGVELAASKNQRNQVRALGDGAIHSVPVGFTKPSGKKYQKSCSK